MCSSTKKKLQNKVVHDIIGYNIELIIQYVNRNDAILELSVN